MPPAPTCRVRRSARKLWSLGSPPLSHSVHQPLAQRVPSNARPAGDQTPYREQKSVAAPTSVVRTRPRTGTSKRLTLHSPRQGGRYRAPPVRAPTQSRPCRTGYSPSTEKHSPLSDSKAPPPGSPSRQGTTEQAYVNHNDDNEGNADRPLQLHQPSPPSPSPSSLRGKQSAVAITINCQLHSTNWCKRIETGRTGRVERRGLTARRRGPARHQAGGKSSRSARTPTITTFIVPLAA